MDFIFERWTSLWIVTMACAHTGSVWFILARFISNWSELSHISLVYLILVLFISYWSDLPHIGPVYLMLTRSISYWSWFISYWPSLSHNDSGLWVCLWGSFLLTRTCNVMTHSTNLITMIFKIYFWDCGWKTIAVCMS